MIVCLIAILRVVVVSWDVALCYFMVLRFSCVVVLSCCVCGCLFVM